MKTGLFLLLLSLPCFVVTALMIVGRLNESYIILQVAGIVGIWMMFFAVLAYLKWYAAKYLPGERPQPNYVEKLKQWRL